MDNLIKKLRNNTIKYGLMLALAANTTPSTSAEEVQNSRTHTAQRQSYRTIDSLINPDEQFESGPATDEEEKYQTSIVSKWFELNRGARIIGKPKITKLRSNKNPSEKLFYFENLILDKSPGRIPSALTFEDDIDVLDEGVNQSAEKIYQVITNTNNEKDKTEGRKKWEELLRGEYSAYTNIAPSDESLKRQFIEHCKGSFTTKGILIEALQEERLHVIDNKNGKYSPSECEDRALCFRILHGRTLENLGRAYNFADHKEHVVNYDLAKRFVKFVDSELKNVENIKNIAPLRAIEITEKYLRAKYSDAEELIGKR